jgi:hypothetical protein
MVQHGFSHSVRAVWRFPVKTAACGCVIAAETQQVRAAQGKPHAGGENHVTRRRS